MSPLWTLALGGAALLFLMKKKAAPIEATPVQQIVDALNNVAMESSWDANEEAYAIAQQFSGKDWYEAVAIIKSTDIVRYSFLELDTIVKAL